MSPREGWAGKWDKHDHTGRWARIPVLGRNPHQWAWNAQNQLEPESKVDSKRLTRQDDTMPWPDLGRWRFSTNFFINKRSRKRKWQLSQSCLAQWHCPSLCIKSASPPSLLLYLLPLKTPSSLPLYPSLPPSPSTHPSLEPTGILYDLSHDLPNPRAIPHLIRLPPPTASYLGAQTPL
jgi:hypothetical protein